MSDAHELEFELFAEAGDMDALQAAASGIALASNSRVAMRALNAALFRRHFAVADWLIGQGVDPDVRDQSGWSPLSWASYNADGPAIEYLLGKGVPINQVNAEGDTPLHGAIDAEIQWAISESEWRKRHVPAPDHATRLLVCRGADINARNRRGQTPLDWAVRMGHKAAEKLLRERGAETGTGLR